MTDRDSSTTTERLVSAGPPVVLTTARIREGRADWLARVRYRSESGAQGIVTSWAKVHRQERGVHLADMMNTSDMLVADVDGGDRLADVLRRGYLGGYGLSAKLRAPVGCWLAVTAQDVVLMARTIGEPQWLRVDSFQEIDLRSRAAKASPAMSPRALAYPNRDKR